MSFNWSDYNELAIELDNNSSTLNEAKLRSAISRAYYSVFKQAYNLLRDVDHDRLITKSKITHHDVRNEFENHRDLDRRSIAIYLGNLHNNRKKADYEDVFSGLQSTTTVSLGMARSAIEKINSITKNSSAT